MKQSHFILILSLLMSSCSFLEKRKESYSDLSRGQHITNIKKKHGNPVSRSFVGNSEILTYDYCETPYWKEAVFGILTFTLSTWTCNSSLIEMKLFFNNGLLYKVQDDTNHNDRLIKKQRMSDAAKGFSQGFSDGMKNKKTSCQTRQIGNTFYTDCD